MVDDSSGAINSTALNQSLNTHLESLQIPTAPKPTDLHGRERLGGIQQYVRNSVFNAQQQLGRKMTPAELGQQVDGLFAQNAQFKTSFLGIPTGSTVKPVFGLNSTTSRATQSARCVSGWSARASR